MTALAEDQQALKDEIADLEAHLQNAKAKLSPPQASLHGTPPQTSASTSTSSLHTLLLLADSALPLGSFAFSSGLESYLAHHRPSSGTASASSQQLSGFHTFLTLSLSSLASTALPYVVAAYRDPAKIEELDNDFDASTPCTVARRASVTQGKALLSVWERSFKGAYSSSNSTSNSNPSPLPPQLSNGDSNTTPNAHEETSAISTAIAALHDFQTFLRAAKSTLYPPQAHYPPLFGLLTRILALPLHSAAYLFLFSHARTVISAAVRASVLGPYQAQAVLAGKELQGRIEGLVEEWWGVETEEAGQVVPVMDLWVGRHEKLYSRIFNS